MSENFIFQYILELKILVLFPIYIHLYMTGFALQYISICVLALAEARDIDLYLRTLERHFQALEDTDFTECLPLFRPLFHVICMVWRDSKYYCSSSKIIVLLKQIGNLLIYQVFKK